MTFPYGYQGNTQSLAEMRTKHRSRYHPEAWRRIEAIAVASGGLIGLQDVEALAGIGGGARTREEQAAAYARAPNTFAPVDQSFHQVWTWASGATGAQAIDWVGRNGKNAEAWKWLRDNGGLYGLLTFWNINGEPWHSQMSDVPNSVSAWLAAGKPDPGRWVLPTEDPSKPLPPDYGLWPLNPAKPEIRQGSLGDAVKYAQRVMTAKAGQGLVADGEYGPATTAAVVNLQYFFGHTPVDGRIDKDEWDVIDALVGVIHTPPAPINPDTPVKVSVGSYWVQPGDSPYKVEHIVYGGTGAKWADHFTMGQFATPNVAIPLPGMPGKTARVLGGEGPYQVIGRMYPEANAYAPGRLQRFYDLNGGKARVLHPGTVVFLDAP